MIKNVMLIDDNKIDLFINQRIIEKYNSEINTRVFTSAISAISFLKILELNVGIKSLTVPDVILVDINMPEMDGFTFFKEFKQLRLLEKYAIEVYRSGERRVGKSVDLCGRRNVRKKNVEERRV